MNKILAFNYRKLEHFSNLSVTKKSLDKIHIRLASSMGLNSEEKYAVDASDDYETLLIENESEINMKRNKSRLKPHHQDMVNSKMPFNDSDTDTQLNFKLARKMFGQYGRASKLNPGTLWPSKSDINEVTEYENIAFPYTIEEVVAKKKQELQDEQEQINKKQAIILQNLRKLNTWKKDIAARSEKKLADIAKAKAKKDVLIEEVRRHFGYKIDPKDPKFKEMLLIKEKAMKKKMKEEKKKLSQERLITDLLNKEKKN